jgi:pyridoxal phosphate enzyme (YggS family)
MTSDLEHNLRSVQARIAEAAARAGRDPNEITLVAVSKTFPAETILAAHALGVRHFGENRVEEAMDKIPQVMRQLPNHRTTQRPNITWHLIGHLQSRKVKDAAALFDFVHSVDSVRLARRLSDRAAALGKTMPILLEVNVSGETSKYGLAPAPRAAFFATVHEILALPNLDVQGLMTIAPIVAQPEQARPHFRALRELRDELCAQFPDRAWKHLSMGMTDDFQAAIAEGATIVRIGRAIFGARFSI